MRLLIEQSRTTLQALATGFGQVLKDCRYDVTADAQRFIICYEPGQPNVAITLVENWDAELKKT